MIYIIIALLTGVTIGLTASYSLFPRKRKQIHTQTIESLKTVRGELMDIDLAWRCDTINQRLKIQAVINRLEALQ